MEVFHHTCKGKYPCSYSLSLCDALSCTQVTTGNDKVSHPPHDPHRWNNAEVFDSSLTVYYQNVRGLRTKIDEFFLAVSDLEYDLIVLTETWLNDVINSAQLFGQGYNVYRKDRNCDISGKTRGGGVLIAIKNIYSSYQCTTCVDPDLEHLWVNVECNKQLICVGVVYIPPEQSKRRSIIERHISSISAIVTSSDIYTAHLLFGDFNFPDLCWRSTSSGFACLEPTESTAPSIEFIDGISLLNFKQLNVARNNLNRTLDLLFVNEESLPTCNLVESHEPLISIDPLHPPLVAILRCPTQTVFFEPTDDSLLDFSRADFVHLNEALLSVDWSVLHNATDVNEAVQVFTTTLIQMFPEFVPSIRPRQKPPWSNNRLRHLKQKRASAIRKFSRNRNSITRRTFHIASSQYKNYNRLLYGRYIRKKEAALKNNPKRFWAFVNEKRKESGLPSSMFLGSETAITTEGICNLFAKQFGSVFDDTALSQAQIDDAAKDVPLGAISVTVNEFDDEDVLEAIRKMKPSTMPGPDGVPSVVLIKCSTAICGPLKSIFNKSLCQPRFPKCWKKSIMFPTYKKGDKRNVSNYRGVTSLSAGSKLFEILMSNKLFRAAKSYMSQDQHGFFPGRSTATNLTQFTSTCLKLMDQGAQIDVIYTDLKAAFDRVNHPILLAKLERMGVATNVVRWMESYLTDRQLNVKIGAAISEPFVNYSGVPQGSNLGPLLFSLFFNDVCLVVPQGCRLLYADDVKIYCVIKSLVDCQRLQAIIDCFASWCERNCLVISVKKCSVISFSRKRSPLIWSYSIGNESVERTNVVKDLGVMLDSELNFREHYNYIINKASRNLGFIFRISSEFRDPYSLRSLYFSLVRSILETTAVVWSPFHNVWINRIERIQSKFVRYALRFLPWQTPNNLPPYESRCRLLGMDTLQTRRCILKTVFIGKVLMGEIDAPWILAQIHINVIPRPLRQRSFLRLPQHRTDYAQHEPMRSMCSIFNLYYHLFDFNISTQVFRNRVANSFI